MDKITPFKWQIVHVVFQKCKEYFIGKGLFIEIIFIVVCAPGYEPNTVTPSCTACQNNTVNPNLNSECVNCNGTSVANDNRTVCSKLSTVQIIV